MSGVPECGWSWQELSTEECWETEEDSLLEMTIISGDDSVRELGGFGVKFSALKEF